MCCEKAFRFNGAVEHFQLSNSMKMGTPVQLGILVVRKGSWKEREVGKF